ncbi:MAG: MFS transporter, partial [Dehalococcoidia bacterium]
RIGVGIATAATYAISALGLVFFVSLSHPSFVFIWAVVFGLGLAGLDLLVSLLWANYYGRAFLGSIRGVYGLSNIISLAGAPLFAAFMYEATGDYQAVFIIFLGAFALAAVMMLFTRRPNPIPMPPDSTPSPDHRP